LRGGEGFWRVGEDAKKVRGELEFVICRRWNEGLNGLMWRNGRERRGESVESQPDKSMVC
jgi:hypothetical protein